MSGSSNIDIVKQGYAAFGQGDVPGILGDGNTVVVLGYEKARVKETGKMFESHWVHVHTLSGGKTTHFLEYTDTAAAAEACR